MDERELPTGRLGRFARLASTGLRVGVGALLDKDARAAAMHTAEVLGTLRGLAAKVGQMDSYVRMFDAQGRTAGDGPTIGLILCAEKNEAIARYSILSEHKQLFAAKYVTYLPTVEELERELARDRRIAEAIVEPPRGTKRVVPKPSARRKAHKR